MYIKNKEIDGKKSSKKITTVREHPMHVSISEKYKNADKFDEIIAVWTDLFNKKFNADPPLDPDVVKARKP